MFLSRSRKILSLVTAMNDCLEKARVRVAMRRVYSLFCCSLLFQVMAGCAGTSPAVLSKSQADMIRHNRSGIKAEAAGESRQALEEFSKALRLGRSIENKDGIIVAMVNSSRVYRRSSDAKAALAMIEGAIPLVTPTAPLYPEVAFEMAQVKLLSGELNEASGWASRAVDADNGAQRGMRINLLARILFLRGNVNEAEVKAREALRLNRENALNEEEANSLRLLGDIFAAGVRYAEARESYNLALVIDKSLGKSRKIAADIRSLARLSLAQNDPDQALVFYNRAFTVSSAGGDRSGAAEDLLQMSRIHEQRGEKEQSERLLMERDTILKSLRAHQ